MPYTIVLTKSAKKDVAVLSSVIKKRLGKKLLAITSLDDIHPIAKRLTNSTIGEYRVRIGDYRVLLDLDGTTMVILRVQHRKEVYRA